jgi:sulfoxide reductase heme-binding subunit YedZ
VQKPRISPLQILVHLAGWTPLALLVFAALTNNLTANPIQLIEQRTGLTALTFLILSLACTPLASLFGWKQLIQRRKALGNYGFLYAFLHVFTFFVIDYGFDLATIWKDVGRKPYVLLGMAAFLMLLPLAVTSFGYWQRRLGKNWKRLHRLVYVIAPLVVLHFFLVVKGDFSRLQGNLAQPLIYGVVIVVLLILRLPPIKKYGALIK